jgi:hypothetical protein
MNDAGTDARLLLLGHLAARYVRRSQVTCWPGYLAHVTETCAADGPNVKDRGLFIRLGEAFSPAGWSNSSAGSGTTAHGDARDQRVGGQEPKDQDRIGHRTSDIGHGDETGQAKNDRVVYRLACLAALNPKLLVVTCY